MITFSYPPFTLYNMCLSQTLSLAFFDVEAFFVLLRLWMNKNVTKMMFIFSADAYADHVFQKKNRTHCIFSEASKFIDPIIFANFHHCVVFHSRMRGEEFTNLFTHRWINTFMRTDGYESKHKIPRYCIFGPFFPENVHALCTNEPRIMQSI